MTDFSSQIHRLGELAKASQLVRRFGYEVVYTQVSPGPLDMKAYEIRVGDCLVFRERFGCHLVAHGTSAPDGFGVMLVVSGTARFFGTEVSPKRLVLFPPGCEIEAVVSPGGESLHFALPRERIESAASNLDVELIQTARAVVVEPGIDRLHHLQALSGRVRKILEGGDLGTWPETEQDLVNIFLGLFDTAALDRRNSGLSNGRVAEHALRVRRHIGSRPLDQLDFDSLSDDLEIGRHHLNRCFKEHFGVSVHEFVHLFRLHQARNSLLVQTTDVSVTDVAYSCGFNHLGRFSTEYRQLFGETPRQTLCQVAP